MLPLVLVGLVACAAAVAGDGCAARSVGGSVVCVCNATYCDTLQRSPPPPGRYLQYTSSKSGLRFDLTSGAVATGSSNGGGGILGAALNIDVDTTYQSIEGFGGAFTDAAGINWSALSDGAKENLIKSYFGESGAEYNMGRVPIGGSDFSTHAYAYNELPVNDAALSNYTLSVEDYLYKLPMLKAAMAAAAPQEVHLVASTWSPPVWMKSNGAITGTSYLLPEYYQTYADYHIKFLQQYAAQEVPIWGVTTTNEPANGASLIPVVQFNSLGWTPAALGQWVSQNLGPSMRSQMSATKILAVDDQRYNLLYYLNGMVAENASVVDMFDGVAVHWYGDSYTPAAQLDSVNDAFPDKPILATEACEGSFPWQLQKVELGSWDRAESYIEAIMEDLNHWVSGWLDWNLCLDTTGGPNWADNNVDASIIVNATADEFYKQPMYYAQAHLSKFVPRGSQRVSVDASGLLLGTVATDNVAFVTPSGTLVLVVNNSGAARSVTVSVGDTMSMEVDVAAASINTFELQL